MILFRRILRYLLYTVLVIVAAAVGALVVLTGTERGRGNFAGIVSSLASSPDRTVTVSGIDGIWSGRLRADHVVVEDRQGPWLVLRDVAIDWSPLALLSKNFSAERVAAGRIEVARLPLPGVQKGESGGQTTLPVSIDIKAIDLPEIALGEALAGAGIAELAAKGSVHADAAPLAVATDLAVTRSDGKAGMVDASVHFVPADNIFDLDLKASEPAGGIIANLLKLPGAPAVDIAVSGKGPLADWSGSGTFAVAGEVVTRLSGRHRLTGEGHYVEARGDGAFERFLPDDLKPLLAGRASFDLAGTATSAGGLDIERAAIDSDALHGSAAGTVDPRGASDLSVELKAKAGPVVLSLGGAQPVTVALDRATLRAFGDGKAPAIDIGVSLVSVVAGGTRLDDLQGQVHSDGFDIQNRSGPVEIKLTAAALNTDVATLAPLVTGRLSASLAGTIGPDEISVDRGTLLSDALNASVTAKVTLADLAITLAMKADAVSTALPAQIRTVLGERVQFSATATRDPEGAFAANSIEFTSGSLSASGTASATGTEISADLRGRLGDVSVLSSLAGVPLAGAVDFSLTAKGAQTAPDFSVFASSSRLSASGREVVGVRLSATGKADIAAPAADISLTGSVEGDALRLKAALATTEGRRDISGLSLSLGENSISGDLALGDDFLPTGTLSLDMPDLAPLAALAGQAASGDIEGTVRLSKDGGIPQADVRLQSGAIARGDLSAKAIGIDAQIGDYLQSPVISGTVKADTVTSGTTVVSGIGVDLRQDGEWTGFSGAATVAGIPAKAAGRAKIAEGTTTVELASGSATVRGIEARIASPSSLTVTGGTAQIGKLALDIAGGSVTVSGSAGEALDLAAEFSALPASLANGFVEDLDAAGTLGGTAHVTGPASDPTVQFDVQLAGAQTSQTRQAKTGPLDVAAKGAYSRAGGVSLEQASVEGEGISASASGTVKPAGGNGFALAIDADIASLPAALANSYVPNLDAVGTLSGAFGVGGSIADPAVRFDAKLAGAETSQTRQAALGPFDLTAVGSYSKAAGVVLDRAAVRGEKISGKASGTIDPAGTSDFSLDVTSTGAGLPLSLGGPESPIDLAVQSLGVKAAGTSGKARLDISAILPSVETRDAKAEGVSLSLHSDAFDIDKRTGPLSATVTARSVGLDNATIAPLIAGQVTAKFAGSLATDAVTIDSGSLTSDALKGTVGGRVSLADGSLDLAVEADAASAALPGAARPVLGERARLSAKLKRDATGNVSANSVQLVSGALTATGQASLADGRLSATVDGALADVSLLSRDADGSITFAATAQGESAAPDPSLTVESERLLVAAREITGLKLTATGRADFENPASNVALTGNVAGQPLKGSAVLKTSAGKRQIEQLSLSLGENRVSGDLVLDDAFVPVGTVSLELPDIGPLAALALEKAEGDLSVTIAFSKQDGSPRVAVEASTDAISRGEVSAKNVTIDALIADYLEAPVISGKIRADSVTSGGTVIKGLDVDLTREGAWTGFSGSATVKDIPARASGRVKIEGGTTTVELKSGDATVRGIKAAIARPSTVTIENGTAALQRLALTIGGGTATVSGTAGETLDLDATLAGVPISIANNFAPGLGAAGAVSGNLKVTGAASSPTVRDDNEASGVEVAQTRGAGFGTLGITSSGRFSNDRLTFDARIDEGSGVGLKGGGTVTIAGTPTLSLDFSGSVPFGFLTKRLAAQGLSLTGAVAVDIKVTGPAARPAIAGTVRSSGARFVDARSGLAINDISLDVAVGNGVARVNRLTGTLSTRGSLTAGGTVGIDPAKGFPADLTVKLTDGRYTDGRIVTANLSGDLAIKGPLASAPAISGTVNLARTVITVPEKLPASLAALDVEHRNAPAAVRAQDRALNPPTAGGGGGSGLVLDVTVNAPNQIFIQGRGVDAELGGSLRLTGPASSPQAVGSFELRRGRLSILGKRLTFTEGTLTFSGSLVPTINLTATSTAGDATVTITVSGEATNPKFTFSSVPALPEDEVLARLIFGRSMSNLSPLQIAQLAEAAGQLAGVGGSTSLLENLRSAIGIDDLDVTTDEEGGAAVSAGKYLNDRTYLSLQKGEKPGSGRARIDLDIGRGVKLRGEATDAGEAKGGIFYEKEY
jgi:translocation and assembly module TamB